MKRVAVFGLALAGTAAAKALVERGIDVVVSDDHLSDSHRSFAASIGAECIDLKTDTDIGHFLEGVDTLVPAPGVPPRHKVVQGAMQAHISIRTEIDIAYEWEQQRKGGPRPVLGVTGTDGKTTTTMLTASILRAKGLQVGEVGNTDVPFIAALQDSYDAFVVECSSFRLQYTDQFRCDASVWLNIAPDHLDWHGTFAEYAEAKKKMWSHVRPADVAIAPVDNPLILDAAHESGARVATFGLERGDYRLERNMLMSPRGPLMPLSSLWRSMPHDVTNSLAAAAVAIESGLCAVDQVPQALENFESAHHRIELVGMFQGSEWYDDSKATSPHAALTAIRAFDQLVLIAGGRNKDLDLAQMASEPHRMRGVVAIGDDARTIADAFHSLCPVQMAPTMKEAVALAASMAEPGVAVLLSPGCTSYDWYNNYNERGDHFQSEVHAYFANESEKN